MPQDNNSGFGSNSGSTGSSTSGSTSGSMSSGSTSSSGNSSLHSSTSGSRSTSSSGGDHRSSSMVSQGADREGVIGMLAKLGLDEQLITSMVDQWRGQLSDTVTHTIQETDLRDAFDKARELTSGSVDRVKEFSAKNPKMFFSGLAAVLVGAGLIAAAARPAGDSDITGTTGSGTDF